MDMRWYGISLQCAECHVVAILTDVAYSADGEFAFTFCCEKCKEQLSWRVFASQLQYQAMKSDVERHTPKGVVPPLRAPYSPSPITERDKNWLRDIGASGEDP
jgi:hypothetical protein